MLEQLFPVTWLERKAWFSFVLGICYATLGIGSALVLFPREPGLAAVAFISLLSLPSLNRILTIEEKQMGRWILLEFRVMKSCIRHKKHK